MTFDWLLAARFLHLFFAFSYVGNMMVIEWNARSARRSSDWRERALLFKIMFTSSTVAGLGGLLLLGVLGNVLSVALGYRMATDAWIRWVNALWLIAMVLMALITIPGAASLARISKLMSESETGTEPPAAFAKTFLRWRLANVAQSILYAAMLVLMVFRWRG
jgi:hypothetical protein